MKLLKMFKIYFKHLTFLSFITFIGILQSHCSSQPPPAPTIKGTTVAHQDQLGPILGPITKEKVLDRLKDYPICGMQSEEQKLTLKVRVLPLNPEKKSKEDHDRTSLIEIECFFFGVQGLYEFAILEPKTGRLHPLSFQGAKPVQAKLTGEEKKIPAAINEGRYEVCGVPEFITKTKTLKSFCKADPEGGCGAYAVYKLASKAKGKEDFDPASAFFELESAHFQSCETPRLVSPENWPEVP